MKKYCFTDCFKRKMSNGAKEILGAIIVLLIVAALMLGIFLISYAVGFGIEYFFGPSEASTAETGLGAIVLFTIASTVIYWTYRFIKTLSTSTFNFVVARYEGDPFKCSIIEECKTE